MVAAINSRNIDGAPWTVEELISKAEMIISSEPKLFAHPESESNKELSVRLIRDYVVREFIPRPERIGREARFGLDHLVQLLAVRVLLRSQKWSLSAIKASFETTSTEDLLQGLLTPVRSLVENEYRAAVGAAQSRAQAPSNSVQTPQLNPAQLLIEQFKAAKKPHAKPQARLLSNRTTATPALVGVPETQRTGSVSSRLHVELEPWCEVVIDAQRLKSLTPEEVERLGEALKSRLLNATAH